MTLDELQVADPADAWTGAGFDVGSGPDPVCRVGGVGIRLVGRDRGTGIVGWSLRGLPSSVEDLDGIPTTSSDADPTRSGIHPNGVIAVDHVVLFSPDLPRTVRALVDVGVHPRRERDAELGGRAIRQIFFRFGEVIVEVVGPRETATEGPSSLWGLTYVVSDVDASAAFFGTNASPVKPAVQPGRRITTLRHRELGMSVRTALISPPILGA